MAQYVKIPTTGAQDAVAVALVQSPHRELPYAVSAAVKKKSYVLRGIAGESRNSPHLLCVTKLS